tara:strand:- start:828 stop:1538 length:711 start_codon:yes stop_codon:yes gene_type:complete
MKCDCNNIGFSYRKLEASGDNFQLVEITCCNTLPIDGKKKKPCNFYNKTIIKQDIVIEHKPIVKNIGDIFHNRTPEENCRKEIDDYINLCKIASCYKSIDNGRYISMINHNLRLLHYKLYNQDTESLDELINRLKYPPDNTSSINKINTLPYKKYKKRKKRNNISKLLEKTEDLVTNDRAHAFLEWHEKFYYDEDNNTSSQSDVLSEDNTIVDGEFDVDNYDSGEEDIDIDEAFSD